MVDKSVLFGYFHMRELVLHFYLQSQKMNIKKISISFLASCFIVNVSHAAFPNDFESGVILVEETAQDGAARRAQGFNDGGINGNVPGLRDFLNNAELDPTLRVEPGPVTSFGPELDFFHDRRNPALPNNWPDGPEASLQGINGVVFGFTQLDERGLPDGFVPRDPASDPFNQPDPSRAGLWAGGTWEFIAVGRNDRSVSALTGPRRFRFGPAAGFVPLEGQTLGFMISGVTRNGINRAAIQARTNVAFFKITSLPPLNSSGFFPAVPIGGEQLSEEEVAELFQLEAEGNVVPTSAINLLLEDD